MFVMINDGGGLNKNASGLEVGRVLTQRTHIFEFLSHGTAVSLLRGSECRDSKVSPTLLHSSAISPAHVTIVIDILVRFRTAFRLGREAEDS